MYECRHRGLRKRRRKIIRAELQNVRPRIQGLWIGAPPPDVIDESCTELLFPLALHTYIKREVAGDNFFFFFLGGGAGAGPRVGIEVR